jgi:hypothetical protein
MTTLADLHGRGIVQGSLFRKQIRSLLSSNDAKRVFISEIEPDRKAIKILSRLENPGSWRELSMKSRENREESFYVAIESIMREDENCGQKLIRMLQLGCMPFFSGFLPFNGQKQEPARGSRPSRVSVLD